MSEVFNAMVAFSHSKPLMKSSKGITNGAP